MNLFYAVTLCLTSALRLVKITLIQEYNFHLILFFFLLRFILFICKAELQREKGRERALPNADFTPQMVTMARVESG